MSIAQKALEYCPGFDEKNDEVNPDVWLSIGKITIEDILKEHILVMKWNEAIKQGIITPNAKNYIKIILDQISTKPSNTEEQPKSGSKKHDVLSFQARVKEKLNHQKK
jgi:hypothetical protein